MQDHDFFVGRLRKLLGDLTFLDAYQRSGRILSIAVTAFDTREPSRLLNYLTGAPVWPRCQGWNAPMHRAMRLHTTRLSLLPPPLRSLPPRSPQRAHLVGGRLLLRLPLPVQPPRPVVPGCTGQHRALLRWGGASSDEYKDASSHAWQHLAWHLGPQQSAHPEALPAPLAPAPLARRAEWGAAQSQRRWCDGSLEQDLPTRGLSQAFGVNFFIVR